MNEIFWPEDYIPGFTDNFASNEVIVAGLSAMDVWPFLSNAPLWPTYYSNSANIRFYDGKGPELEDGVRFYFETFGFPVEAQVLEYVPPAEGTPGRIGWHGWGGARSLWRRPHGLKQSRVALAGMAGAAKAIHASTCTTPG